MARTSISTNWKGYKNMTSITALAGLDYVTPPDEMADGRSPEAHDFRLYAAGEDDRQVAVSTRKGQGEYVSPLGEVISLSNTSTTGASTVEVGILDYIVGQPFVAADSNMLSSLSINMYNPNGANCPMIVSIYTDNNGIPDILLAQSSISPDNMSIDTIGYYQCRFIDAVKLTSGTTYWIILQQQDDGKNTFTLSTTTNGTTCYTSSSTLSMLSQQTYGINFNIYTVANTQDSGAYRLTRDNGENRTIVAYDNTMYYIDETNGEYIKIIDGLNSEASYYSFAHIDNKVAWVNGYDELTMWNGVHEDEADNIITNSSFTTDTTGWTLTTIARSTADYNTSPASIYSSSTTWTALYSTVLSANHRYRIDFYSKSTNGGSIGVRYTTSSGNTTIETFTGVSTSWTKYSAYFTPTADTTSISLFSTTNTGYIDDVVLVDTGIEYIIDEQLPTLSQVSYHKDRLWGVTSDDPNKLVFSEVPGNPAYKSDNTTATTADEQWYHAWLSVSFIYVPRPYNGSPITGIVSFQDNLVVFTQDNKYSISGYDSGSFNLTEATGNMGALSFRGVVNDENNIYFVSDDGFYMYNGSSDTKISTYIDPLFDACGHQRDITPVIYKDQVRFYMASRGSDHNDICAIFNKTYTEWMLDTNMHINRALYYNDADDDKELIEFSSLIPAAYRGEYQYSSLGAPIDFLYKMRYNSFGTPAQKKKLQRFFPLLLGVENTFNIDMSMDKDFQGSPKSRNVALESNGATWGEFNWDDGTLWGGGTTFKQHRQSYSGYAYYWQPIIARKAVNNRVAFFGVQIKYKTKRI